MQMKQWGIRLALGFVFCVGALGCHLTDTFLAQATVTPTRTRTVKPTFTTIPSPTVTPIPPTPTPTLTATPTRRPTPRPPTKPTPTRPPAPPPHRNPLYRHFNTALSIRLGVNMREIIHQRHESTTSKDPDSRERRCWLNVGLTAVEADFISLGSRSTTKVMAFYTFTLSADEHTETSGHVLRLAH